MGWADYFVEMFSEHNNFSSLKESGMWILIFDAEISSKCPWNDSQTLWPLLVQILQDLQILSQGPSITKSNSHCAD